MAAVHVQSVHEEHAHTSEAAPVEARVALLIDDSAFALATARRALEAHGWTVRATPHANAAVASVPSNPPDIIVCDLHMPDVDGLAVMRRVAALKHPPPVIMLSGDNDLSAVLEVIRAGAFDYVVKTNDLSGTLPASADRAWRHARVIQENRRLNAELDARCAELEREVQTRARTEEALRMARDHAVAGSRAKSAFLAHMSHELRTPLNAILGYSDMLAEEMEEQNDPRVADLARIRDAGSHLLALIKDVLDLAKIEAGRQELELSELPVAALIDQLRTTIEPLAAQRKNQVIFGANTDLVLTTDVVKVRQCLLNLLGNAAKFTQNGTILLNVFEEPGPDGAPWVRFEVIDTGIGMTDEQASRVFQAFEQADMSTTRQFGGTGLGLTITRRLVELMRGTITLASVPGCGSTFTITMPVALGSAT